jgi:hypothetical protein
VFQMRDLMVDVLSGQGPLFFADTCRISGAPPAAGRPGCERHSARPDPRGGEEHGGGAKPEPPPPVCAGSKAASVLCDRDRGPRRASGLDSLRQALRSELAGRP